MIWIFQYSEIYLKEKEKLLKKFGSYKKIKEASLAEIQEVIGQKVGKSVYEQLQQQE